MEVHEHNSSIFVNIRGTRSAIHGDVPVARTDCTRPLVDTRGCAGESTETLRRILPSMRLCTVGETRALSVRVHARAGARVSGQACRSSSNTRAQHSAQQLSWRDATRSQRVTASSRSQASRRRTYSYSVKTLNISAKPCARRSKHDMCYRPGESCVFLSCLKVLIRRRNAVRGSRRLT
eukprot:6133955-Pyramimonas_sp.AAC.1